MQATQIMQHSDVDDACELIHWYIAGLVQCNTIGQCENTTCIKRVSVTRSWYGKLTRKQTTLLNDFIARRIRFNVVVSTTADNNTRLVFTKKHYS